MDCTILIPVRNEEANLRPLVNGILAQGHRLPTFEILFVNDCSEDGTEEVLRDIQRATPHVRHITLSHKSRFPSVGTAIRRGLEEAKGQEIVIMDGDLTHDPHSIPDLLQGLETADMVIGSRYVKDKGMDRWLSVKGFFSSLTSYVTHAFIKVPVHDCSHGYRAMRSSILPELSLRSKGFPIYYELTVRSFAKGLHIAEIPIQSLPRIAHESKFKIGPAFLEYFEFMIRVFFPIVLQRVNRIRPSEPKKD